METLRRWLSRRAVVLGAGLVSLDGCGGRLRLGGEAGAAGEESEISELGGTAGVLAAAAGTTPTAGGGGAGGGSSGGAGGSISLPGISCDWQTALQKSCAISTCHGPVMAYAELLLTVDAGLIARIKDVPATLSDVDCDPGGAFAPCTTPPAECQPYVGAKRVDSRNPDASFILAKLRGSGCGNQMPLPPGNSPTAGWNDERRFCLEQFVRAVAALP
jgi:hypothetical protein